MERFAAFLRAINVGGRRVTNDELRACVETAGLVDVATFRAAGNVVFSAARADGEQELALRIAGALEQRLGYEVPVLVRDDVQMRALAAHEPFDPALVAASDGKLQVLLLESLPDQQARAAVLAHATADDRLAFGARELYWLPRGRTTDSALDFKAVAGLVGVNTQRTKSTIELLAAKHFAA